MKQNLSLGIASITTKIDISYSDSVVKT